MITLFGSLLGFLGSIVPDFFKLFQDKRDKIHEIELMKLQIEQQKNNSSTRLEEVRINSETNNLENLYKNYNVGVRWVDALNGTVRPVIAYSFFLLYGLVKILSYLAITQNSNASFSEVYPIIWNEEDAAIFAGVISFYFGQRAMGKVRK